MVLRIGIREVEAIRFYLGGHGMSLLVAGSAASNRVATRAVVPFEHAAERESEDDPAFRPWSRHLARSLVSSVAMGTFRSVGRPVIPTAATVSAMHKIGLAPLVVNGKFDIDATDCFYKIFSRCVHLARPARSWVLGPCRVAAWRCWQTFDTNLY